MKNTITKIAIVSFVALSFAAVVSADNSVFVSPASGVKTAGETVNATVELAASPTTTCVVTGDVAFSNLACQNITVAAGVMAQTMPSCQSTHFVLGIPQCTVNAKTLLNISAKTVNPGDASIALSKVTAINQNGAVASTSLGATYHVLGLVRPVIAQGGVKPAATSQPAEQAPQTTGSPAADNGTVIPLETSPAGVPQPAGNNSFLASLQSAVFSKETAWILLILAVLAGVYYAGKIYYKKEPPKKL